mgnify:CR=1 FL=1
MSSYRIKALFPGLSVSEVAAQFGVHYTTVHGWIRRGELDVIRRDPIRIDIDANRDLIRSLAYRKHPGAANMHRLTAERYGIPLETYLRLRALDWHPCSACRVLHPRSEFTIDNSTTLGIAGVCRAAKAAQTRVRRGRPKYPWLDGLACSKG